MTESLEDVLKLIASNAALGIEMVAVLVVTLGAAEALVRTFVPLVSKSDPQWLKHLWSRFGKWLLLGLQFALAADIVRSTISPNWEEIGHLAAIAVIRTFLSYFLERDLVELSERSRSETAA